MRAESHATTSELSRPSRRLPGGGRAATLLPVLAAVFILASPFTNQARAQGPAAGTISFSIPDRGGISTTSSGTAETLRSGYGRIRADAGSTTPSGIAIFQFRDSQGVLISEAGVPATEPVLEGRIFAEVDGPVNTGLAIANPNDETATIDFYFTDTDGTSFSYGTVQLDAHQQTAKFLNQPPFNSGGSPVRGTFTFESSVPIAVIALRGFTNEAGEFLMTTLPVASLSSASEETVYIPHFAAGGGWVTQVILVNPTDSTITGTVGFLGPGSDTTAASPVILTLDDGSTGSNFDYLIPPRSSQRFTTSNPYGTLNSGSVRATPNSGNAAPSGLVVFSYAPAGKTLSEAGVPALAKGSGFRVYAEASGTLGQMGSISTGLAITNAADTSNTVTLEVTNLDGSLAVAPATLALPPSGQVARFLNDIFSLPDNFFGVLRVTSTADVAIVALRLRVNAKGEIKVTTLAPSNEMDPATSAETFFPHIADSGGWSTQFILFSGAAGQASSGTLTFIDASGQPLDLSVLPSVEIPASDAPDLVVQTPSVSDSSPNTGQSFTLIATVRNQGNAQAAATTLRYYRSTDATISTGDTEVGTNTLGGLSVSGVIHGSINLDAPLDAGTYYYGACVDPVAEEIATGNNCSSAVAVIVSVPTPDLVVETYSGRWRLNTGGSFTLRVTVRNQGNGRAAATTLRYYRSIDATISTGDTEVGTYALGRWMSASSVIYASISLAAPLEAGTYYYGACVDPVAEEIATGNNCSSANVVVIVSGVTPDLVVQTPSASPSSPNTGQTFTLRVTVRNQGNAQAAATTLRYYRSTDATISTGDTEVGTDAVGGLSVSGTSDESISLAAPLVAGTYYYGACVDPVAGETATGNCSSAVAVIVSVTINTATFINLDAANDDAAGIAFANSKFYVVDTEDDKVYAYTYNGQRAAASDFNLDEANNGAAGIAFANNKFYVVDLGDDKVYAYTYNGQRAAASDFNLHSTNEAATGITFANGWFCVVDATDRKVYTYLSSGASPPGDFDLDQANNYPTGIVFANGKFYVVDRSDDKVYVYTDNGQRAAASDFNLHSTIRKPGGIVFANGWFYVVDEDDGAIPHSASGY